MTVGEIIEMIMICALIFVIFTFLKDENRQR